MVRFLAARLAQFGFQATADYLLSECAAADEEADKKEETATSSAEPCPTCPDPKKDDDGDDGDEKKKSERKNDPIKDHEKLERQMKQRGWTYDSIEEAVQSGEKFPAKNFKTGRSATRYVHPKTGQSVVIDDTTNGVIHVGGKGFAY